MLLVDTKEKRIIQDVQLKLDIARSRPHSDWLREQVKKNNLILLLLTFNLVIIYQHLMTKNFVCLSDAANCFLY